MSKKDDPEDCIWIANSPYSEGAKYGDSEVDDIVTQRYPHRMTIVIEHQLENRRRWLDATEKEEQ